MSQSPDAVWGSLRRPDQQLLTRLSLRLSAMGVRDLLKLTVTPNWDTWKKRACPQVSAQISQLSKYGKIRRPLACIMDWATHVQWKYLELTGQTLAEMSIMF